MSKERRLGRAQEQVLQALANGAKYGFEIMDGADLPSGAVYPALARLERLGFVRSRWENAATAEREKRPRRRYYAVTAAGTKTLTQIAAQYREFHRAMPKAVRLRENLNEKF
ncbi:MAG: PadR family transcriptional regulator [Gemmatimonadota bacterium]|nr:PadR family transcriptional regulator [Gemmatimonadota bacterium]